MIKYPGSTALTKIFQLFKSKFDSLATVATTGSYNDLADTPDIGSTNRATISISEDGTSIIDIPITISDINSLSVYQNGLLLTPSVHYTATTTAITLVGYTANAGDIFTFVGNNEAGVSLNASASQVLFSDTTSDNCYGESATVQDALIKASEFKSDIKKISVNGIEETPDSDGNVDIKVPSVPVKSISVNGTTVDADSEGNVNITVPSAPIQSISLNSTSINPDDNGNVNINLSNYPTTDTMNSAINTAIDNAITVALGADYS